MQVRGYCVALSLFICLLQWISYSSGLMCYTCSTRNGNFACNRMILRCDLGYEACEARTTVKGTGHLSSIMKGCAKTCSSTRPRRRCRDTGSGLRGCSYCCTGDLCNVGLAQPRGINDVDSTDSRNGNGSLELYPSFSLVANNVIERVDQNMPMNMINISRTISNTGNLITEELGFAEITILVPGTYVFHATSVAMGPGFIATPVILLRNHDVVMRVGRQSGTTASPFPFASDSVVLNLLLGDIIILATSPSGSNNGPFSSPSDVTFSGYLLHRTESNR